MLQDYRDTFLQIAYPVLPHTCIASGRNKPHLLNTIISNGKKGKQSSV